VLTQPLAGLKFILELNGLLPLVFHIQLNILLLVVAVVVERVLEVVAVLGV
jgi:hypothetical protein